jgi:hypothetical protein
MHIRMESTKHIGEGTMERLKLLQGYTDKYGINLTMETRGQLEELAEMRQQLFLTNNTQEQNKMNKNKVRYSSWYDWQVTPRVPWRYGSSFIELQQVACSQHTDQERT